MTTVHVEVGMVRVSFWLEDPANPSAYGGIDYVMDTNESNFIHDNRERFSGRLDETGGNYVILKYDSLVDLHTRTHNDAITLRELIDEYSEWKKHHHG